MSKRAVISQQTAETLEEAIRSTVTDEVFTQRIGYRGRATWHVLVRDPSSGQWEVVSSVEEARAVVAMSVS